MNTVRYELDIRQKSADFINLFANKEKLMIVNKQLDNWHFLYERYDRIT